MDEPRAVDGLDAAVVGSGPNGLAAAVTLARAGARVTVYEAAPQVGGAARTAVRQVPGVGEIKYDVGSAVHPTALASAFFAEVGLTERVEFRCPEMSYAHPLDGGDAGLVYRDLGRTLAGLEARSPAEADAYWRIMAPLVARQDEVARLLLNPVLPAPQAGWGTTARVGLAAGALAVPPLANALEMRAPTVAALLAGLRAHLPGGSSGPGAQGAALLLGALAHGDGGGWAIPVGGSGAITAALAEELRALGGRIELGRWVRRREELPEPLVLFATAPEALAKAVPQLPEPVARRLKQRRRGPGAAVAHFVIEGAIPWTNSRLAGAGALHLGGTAAEIRLAERASRNRFEANPFVLVSQPGVVDDSRAPEGYQVIWSYMHVPNGMNTSENLITETITAQIERYAPGFRDALVDAWADGPAALEAANPSLVGGDIAGGAVDTLGLLGRPGFGLASTMSGNPWRSPVEGVYLCSASTPPGPAVHGMAGHLAARAALRDWGP